MFDIGLNQFDKCLNRYDQANSRVFIWLVFFALLEIFEILYTNTNWWSGFLISFD